MSGVVKLKVEAAEKTKHVYVYDKMRKRMVGEYDLPETASIPIEASVQVATYLRACSMMLSNLIFLVADTDDNFTIQCKRATDAMVYNPSYIRLTPRENQVLAGIVAGKQNKEIADDLGLRQRTVKFHVSSLLAKYNCSGRGNLALIVSRAFSREQTECPA